MKNTGQWIVILGVCGLIYSFLMDTSVGVNNGIFDRVNNMGLMNTKLSYIVISCFTCLCGTILIAGDRSEELKLLRKIAGTQDDEKILETTNSAKSDKVDVFSLGD